MVIEQRFGNESVLLFYLTVRYKLFDLVDCDRSVYVPSGALVLTSSVAYPSADCRQRVVLLYELKSIQISALGRELDIALYGDVRGAGSFARRCPALFSVVSRASEGLSCPSVFSPLKIVRKIRVFELKRLLLTDLLTHEYGIVGACRCAFAAGDALLRVYFRNIVAL